MKTFLKRLVGFLGVVVMLTLSPVVHAGDEAWKGEADPSIFDFSAMAGLGIVDPKAGLAVAGAMARKIVHEGFIPDIRNSVWIEALVGPNFVSGGTPFMYSTHLRWDFRKDAEWTYYVVAGVGGHITGPALGDRFLLHPRMGAGALWTLSPVLRLRGEVSHELTMVGVNFPF